MMRDFQLNYGRGQLTVSLPEKNIQAVIEGRPVAAVDDVAAAVRAAVRRPIGAPPLDQVVAAGDKVAVVVSDITRQWLRYDLFLPTLLDELNRAGVPDRQITLVVALGSHRPHTAQEHRMVYGDAVVRRVNIVQSEARRREDFTFIGRTSRGVEVKLNKAVVEADKVILTGGIVYHSMAGFGGGRKSVIPGVASYDTIQQNHHFCLTPNAGGGINPACGCGYVQDNPMDQDLKEAATLLNPAFLLNAVFTPDGQFASFVAGHWLKAWEEGCRLVREIYGVPLAKLADLALVSAGGHPKDINLYQGSKAIENAALAVRPGGVIVALLACPDIAEPPDFSQWFDYRSLDEREQALRRDFTVPGFVALKMGVIAAQTPVIMVTRQENRDFVAKTGCLFAATPQEALAMAEARLGADYRAVVMPHGASTLPIL